MRHARTFDAPVSLAVLALAAAQPGSGLSRGGPGEAADAPVSEMPCWHETINTVAGSSPGEIQ